LVASLGVAAVNYAYACSNNTVANLAPPPQDGAADAPKDSSFDAPMEAIVANLAPPPADAGLDADDSGTSADAGDAQAD
jgi:hypothetical protein